MLSHSFTLTTTGGTVIGSLEKIMQITIPVESLYSVNHILLKLPLKTKATHFISISSWNLQYISSPWKFVWPVLPCKNDHISDTYNITIAKPSIRTTSENIASPLKILLSISYYHV